MDTKEYYTTAEVAEVLRCSIQTIRRRIKSEALPAIRISGRMLVPREALDRIKAYATAQLEEADDE